MARIIFKPYKNGCAGLSLVKDKLKALGYRVIETKVKGVSKYKELRNDTIINWGVGTGGKINQFNIFHRADVPCPVFTTDRNTAIGWLAEGQRVLCRLLLNGHGGAGIIVCDRNTLIDDVPNAPLYVKYTPKKREFRVHVFNDDTYVAEKKLRVEGRPENYNKYIRNHENGWVFCKNFEEPVPDSVIDTAKQAVNALGLLFGAVDIGYHQEHGTIVYECNSAPGIDSTTADWYVEQIQKML